MDDMDPGGGNEQPPSHNIFHTIAAIRPFRHQCPCLELALTLN